MYDGISVQASVLDGPTLAAPPYIHRCQHSQGLLKYLHLDLSDLSSVRDAARRFAQDENKLNVLWNNAGIGPNAVEYGVRTAQDLELFNGGALLWLTSILVDTSAPRDGVNFAVLETGTRDQTTNYAASKAGAWVLGREFGRRHAPNSVISVVMNPSSVDAGAFKGTPRFAISIVRQDVFRAAESEELGGLGYGKKLWEWCETK
ncbi:hypothetical protein F4779DRAFT_633229 [Xylariaceae sp. FL0662B]|nr:hypothetical protein F4779DRAFT_633229 [Xylariaceae sp. FL0662B]